MKGKESTLSETMLDFQLAGGMPFAGVFGSYPHAIGQVLRKNHMSYSMVSLDEMTKEGVYIISYWTGATLGSSIHTVAISYDGSGYITYNYDGFGQTSVENPKTYASNFICGYYLGGM